MSDMLFGATRNTYFIAH